MLSGFMAAVHGIAGWTMIVAIFLHFFVALKHHFIDKDNTL
jgi:cytochrome b561